MDVSHLFLLTAALSFDSLAAGFLYGADRVRIPFASLTIISVLSSVILTGFLFFGSLFQTVLSENAASLLCFLILFGLGLAKLFDGSLKALCRRFAGREGKLKLRLPNITFLLTVYADPEAANGPDYSILSPKEAFSLGIVLALDSAAAGFGAGLSELPLFAAFLVSFLFTAAALLGGSFLGRKLSDCSSFDFSWLSGLLLIGLAFLKKT